MSLEQLIHSAIKEAIREHLQETGCLDLQNHLGNMDHWRVGGVVTQRIAKPEAIAIHRILLKDALDEYYDQHLKKLATGDERLGQLERATADLLTHVAGTITQSELVGSLSKWEGPTYNRYKVALVHFWKWMRIREYTDLRPELESQKETSRDNVLDLEDLRKLYTAADTRGEWKGFCKLLILTGQRRGEVASLVQEQIKGDEWHQPTSKNGTAHIVHLGPIAQQVVSEGITWTGKTTFSDMKRRWSEAAGLDTGKWKMHDIRRSFATHCVESGMDENVVDRVLNHQAAATSRGVARVYNRAKLLTERRQVILDWEKILLPETKKYSEYSKSNKSWEDATHSGGRMMHFGDK